MYATAREKIVVLLLPALVATLAYALVFNRHGAYLKAAANLEEVRAKATPPSAVVAKRALVASATQDVAKATERKAALDKRWQALAAARVHAPAARATAFLRLSEVLWTRGLHTLEETPLTGGDGKLPASLEEALKALSPKKTVARPQLWKVRFLGRYADVVAALETLSTDDSSLTPIAISMAEAPLETDWRSWTLLLWM